MDMIFVKDRWGENVFCNVYLGLLFCWFIVGLVFMLGVGFYVLV